MLNNWQLFMLNVGR
jgi:hypothetical protein